MLPHRTSRTPMAWRSRPTCASARASWQSSLYGGLRHLLVYWMPPSLPSGTSIGSTMRPSGVACCQVTPSASRSASHALPAACMSRVAGHVKPRGMLSPRPPCEAAVATRALDFAGSADRGAGLAADAGFVDRVDFADLAAVDFAGFGGAGAGFAVFVVAGFVAAGFAVFVTAAAGFAGSAGFADAAGSGTSLGNTIGCADANVDAAVTPAASTIAPHGLAMGWT